MTTAFNPAERLIFVEAFVVGPVRAAELVLALDTGASRTMIDVESLRSLGCSVDARGGRATTASGDVPVGRVSLNRLFALDVERSNFPVNAHPLPPNLGIDGLLGLDFFRGQVLTIDFARGRIDLGPVKKWWRSWK